jgi:hypothetical protein
MVAERPGISRTARDRESCRVDSFHQNANGLGAAQRRRPDARLGRGASGRGTLYAMSLDPGHGPINELPLPKEPRRCLADKGGWQLMGGLIGGPKRREIVGLQPW